MENTKNNKVVHNIGDTLEKAGKKISDAGATRVGNAVYNTGDKIEHSGDNKKNIDTNKNSL